ncbi:wd40 repeat-containing protein [Hyaloraphidium curvatum]|nr:wd40 repeat-containing protein [Hyaloraphidium curvatum]
MAAQPGNAPASPPPSPSFPWTLEDPAGSRWKGHRDAVLTLDAFSEPNGPRWLASGSEDGTVRVWDASTGRTTRCYACFGGEPVSAVAFGDGSRLFAAAGRDAFELDLRAPGVVLREPKARLERLASDEINQLAVQRHPRTGAPQYLAAADDSGKVTVLDASVSPPKQYKTLSRRGRDQAMCTCAAFRPRGQWDLACGYLVQGELGLWDFGRARCRTVDAGAAVRSGNPLEDQGDGTGLPNQMFNPPYLHGLAFDASGRCLAAALGSGDAVVYEWARAEEGPLAVLRGGHASSLAGVCFLDREGGTEGGLFLATAGNDRVVNLWECSTTVEGGGLASRVVRKIHGLPGKPNWIASVWDGDGGLRLFVACTTPEIAVYRLAPSVVGTG